jgi:hypothetical protein
MAMMPGNYIAHNHFEDLSRNGIFAFRNQGGNVIEYNLIKDCMQTTIDGAAIHFATMNRLNAPNFILNNYLYDIWGYEQLPRKKPKRHLANGVFLDWATSNTTIKNNYIYNAGGKAIKNIMGNWELSIENNYASDSKIVPPFIEEIGIEGTATNCINPDDLFLEGKVISFQDNRNVELYGDWKRTKATGFWGLFEFDFQKACNKTKAKAIFNLPINETGVYKLCILYFPEENNATNATIEVVHVEGKKKIEWNMREGDEHGFALEIGKFRLSPDSQSKIIINNNGANGSIVANAISFIKISD